MFRAHLRLLFAFVLFAVFVAVRAPVRGQDEKPDPEAKNKEKTKELLEKAKEEYRIYFKEPDKTIEYWAAIKFEMDLGKFDLAALHLKKLLKKEPPEDVDKDLVQLEAAEGMSAFLRLGQVRHWSEHPPFQKEAVANVEALIGRVTSAVEKHLSDPVRLKKFINQLVAPTEEERAFAYAQLARSRERATPYLVDGLRVHYGKALFVRLREVLLRIGPETVPVYLEVFKAANAKDARDVELRMTLLDIVNQRDDKRVIPYLWHLSSAKQYPEAVRRRAKEVLASLLRLDVKELPVAKETLTLLAEKYYQHKVPFSEGKAIRVWPWDGEAISLKPVDLSPASAEEFFGLRYARQALDLDPSYQPAQVVLLSLMLDRQYRSKIDKALLEPTPPKMHELLTTIDAELATRTLERALEDRQVPVILPLIQALGERGEYRSILLNASGRPRGVVRALYYPDRRVQFAAMKAVLRMPASVTSPAAADRVVELSRRFLAAEPNPKALVAFSPKGQEQAIRQTVKELKLDALLSRDLKGVFERGKAAADIDLIVLHHGMAEQEFPFIYSQLRKDVDLGGLPTLVIVDKSREKVVKKLTARDANVMVLTDDRLQAGPELKTLVDKLIASVQIARLTEAERKEFARLSMDTLWRISRGEIAGYNVTPALDAITDQLRNPDYATLAMEILGRMPGKEIQYRLAGIVADPNQDKKMRLPAAMELNRHMQKNGVQLDRKQLKELKLASLEAGDDPLLRAQLNVTASLVARSTARQTGAQLFQFRPDPVAAPQPAPPAKEKDDKKDNQ